ncbi:hypothetical protein CSV86_005655 [Pseudomonas putida CSV86]|uniref:Uncharacterized protein n=1 Tax=Pseudomonas bharatica CSV86 TaxID=1005395 RepID=L1LUA3_9PSED|nr:MULTISPECIES: hypothetical protein [Pseudomonas]MDG9886545.1 hypothetical protein [Pseudomonas sp. GD04058]NNJ14764.1 hypothetical protein [Pseudomonas bharatica CSV86]
MDVKTLAQYLDINAESVIDHKLLDGAAVLRVDLSKEPQLLQPGTSRGTPAADLPEEGVFAAELTVDGVPRPFSAQHIKTGRNKIIHEDDGTYEPVPAWLIVANMYHPNCTYDAAIEKISIWSKNAHSGLDHDLSEPDHSKRPIFMYALGYAIENSAINLIVTWATAGNFWFQHYADVENGKVLTGRFNDVQFRMPNCHEYLDQAPDREFEVSLPSGSYNLRGTW